MVWLGRDIKLSHTVFAMPFALLAAILAANGFPGWTKIGLIVVCMFLARTFAMLANRYVDRDIDARNPRTAGRAIPAGKLTARDVMVAMVVCGLVFIGCAAAFGWLFQNWWPAIFAPIVLIWLGVYGLFKRFTMFCHFFLGGALAISPLAAGLAIEPSYLTQPTLWWMAGFVLLWVGGFDVIYAMQDMEVDRRDGLHSIPAKFGPQGSLIIAKVAHLLALVALIAVEKTSTELTNLFFYGVIGVGVLLIVEHHAASRGKFSMAFFMVNGVISLMLGALGIIDILR